MPAKNKVTFAGETLIDLTGDTIAPETLEKGATAHDKTGKPIVGTLEFSTIYKGTSAPSNSIGKDGDIFVVT